MIPLKGRTFLVTGASSGIGAALCEQLLSHGANVLGVTRRPGALHPDVSPIKADLTSREDISAIFHGLGKIDGLINCAGIAYLSRIVDGNSADWEEMWRVNVLALSLCCQLSLKHFPKSGGRIVNVSSMSGHRVPPSGGFYAPTKFAVRAITEALRSELSLAKSPVRVSSISPGYVDTPLLNDYFKGREDQLAETRAKVNMLTPENIATTALHILTAPAGVEINDVLLRSSDQAV